jgi:hypothetical protein
MLVYAAEGKDSARLPEFWGEPPFDYYLHDGYNTPCLPSLQRICAVAHKPHCRLLPAAVLRSPLHALILSKSNPLLGAGLRSLCEDSLVGLVEVLGLALLAVL